MNPLEARRRLLGRNVYKRTTEGSPAIAQGSLARRYPGITMQGWTEQDSTTGAQLFDEKWESGFLNVTNGEDVSDINSIRTGFIKLKNNASYYFSFPGKNDYYPLLYDKNKSFIRYLGLKIGDFSFTTDNNTEFIRIAQYKNTSIVENVMLNEGSTALSYEPYTGGQPSPSPDYPQPITNAGKYNEGTGKWEYEITFANAQTDPDKNQTVTLTSDRPLTKWDKLEKRNGQWGWVYGSDEYIAPKTGYQMYNRLESATGVYFLYTIWDDIGIEIGAVLQNQFCNYFKLENPYTFKGNAFWIVKLNEIEKPVLRIGLSDENIDTVEEFEQFLSALDDIKILYKKANTEFVPLSSEEQEAMNSLYTFRPTTVLSNDRECDMSLTYKTKKSMQSAPGGYPES